MHFNTKFLGRIDEVIENLQRASILARPDFRPIDYTYLDNGAPWTIFALHARENLMLIDDNILSDKSINGNIIHEIENKLNFSITILENCTDHLLNNVNLMTNRISYDEFSEVSLNEYANVLSYDEVISVIENLGEIVLKSDILPKGNTQRQFKSYVNLKSKNTGLKHGEIEINSENIVASIPGFTNFFSPIIGIWLIIKAIITLIIKAFKKLLEKFKRIFKKLDQISDDISECLESFNRALNPPGPTTKPDPPPAPPPVVAPAPVPVPVPVPVPSPAPIPLLMKTYIPPHVPIGVTTPDRNWIITRRKQTKPRRIIMITGYWPPTNKMLEGLESVNNWEGRDFDIRSFYPIFLHDFPKLFGSIPDIFGPGNAGLHDFMVDYQKTAESFWSKVKIHKPIAIICTGATWMNPHKKRLRQQTVPYIWFLETRQRNLSKFFRKNKESWNSDFIPAQYDEHGKKIELKKEDFEKLFPTPGGHPDDKSPFREMGLTDIKNQPPDNTVSVDSERLSTLPMKEIATAINKKFSQNYATVEENEWTYPGSFLCEYIGYLACWYRDTHLISEKPCRMAGFVHVMSTLPHSKANEILKEQLRAVINKLKNP